ncbi:hypothetical protein PUN28_017714 [Cardiocondyla obscurior]|uniref:NADH dehydrogenase [ubiquinone] 1 beta subcomplex subunit 5, mitochondrial n=1 Tax=Cardiocondyla obscurior TaxID=286306 RepID=A0AAW2EN16_9HYME
MAVWSSILRATRQKLLQSSNCGRTILTNGQVRCMSEDRTFVIRPSRFQWHKTKDWFHFYFLLGAIPVGIGITLTNVFIGPATLQEIPEGYVPKEWEYLQHPIKRFFQRYLFPSPQQEYEKQLHIIYHESQLRKVRCLEHQVNQAMALNRDYRSNYFKEFYGAKYLHLYKRRNDERSELDE